MSDIIHAHPVLKAHGYKPRLPIAPVEEGRGTVLEFLGVADSLIHGFAHVQPFYPLYLNMYSRQAHKVGNFTKAEPAALYFVPVLAEKGGKLTFTRRPLPLGCFTRLNHLL